jgi:hypothetical protein
VVLCQRVSPLLTPVAQANLAWKLALVLTERASPRLLETYTTERVPVIAEMLRRSTELLDAMLRGDLSAADVLMRDPALRQLGVNYEWSAVVYDERRAGGRAPVPQGAYGGSGTPGLWAGDRAPNATDLRVLGGGEALTSLFDLFSLAKHTVLVFVGQDAAEEDAARAFLDVVSRQPGGACQTLLVFEQAPQHAALQSRADVAVMDSKGYAAQFYEAKAGIRAAVVRPDGAVGAMVKTSEGLANALKLVFDMVN